MKTTIVLMYHDICHDTKCESGFQNTSAFQYKISAQEFEKHVSAIRLWSNDHPDTEVIFSFDDGGVSFISDVAPILEKYNYKGIFFISTQYIDMPLFLTANQVRQLVSRGHMIGSHSHSHPVLTTLTDEQILKEWKTSVEIIKEITGQDEIIGSIPNGDENKVVISKAKAAGISTLYTSTPTTNIKFSYNMAVIGRYVVYQGMTTDDVMAIINSRMKRNIMYFRWYILRTIKRIMGNHYNKLKKLIFN